MRKLENNNKTITITNCYYHCSKHSFKKQYQFTLSDKMNVE